MTKLEGLTVLFPYLNDAGSIDRLLDRAAAAADAAAERREIIVVDDGSRPDQAAALDAAAAARRGVRVVRHAANLGYGAAIRRGLRESLMPWVFYTDGDGQYDPSELVSLWERWVRDRSLDLVNGYKRSRSDGWHRAVLGGAYRAAARRLGRLPIRDVDCDFRLMRGDWVRSLRLTCEGGAFGYELAREARRTGARVAEVGVGHHPRRHGRSEFFTPRHLWNFGRELLALAARGSDGRD